MGQTTERDSKLTLYHDTNKETPSEDFTVDSPRVPEIRSLLLGIVGKGRVLKLLSGNK